MTHRVISTYDLHRAEHYITWFVGTKEQCEQVLPRIEQWATKTSDNFRIIKQ
jgi:hypothetical protein